MIWVRGATAMTICILFAAVDVRAQEVAPSPAAPAAQPAVPATPPQDQVQRPQANNLPNAPIPPGAPAPGSFVANRAGGQALTSALRGRAVYDSKNEKIGEVGDFVLDPDGRVSAVVLAVGGVLGLGTKDVAVPFGDLKTGNLDGRPIFVLEHTPEEVRNAPAFSAGAPPKS